MQLFANQPLKYASINCKLANLAVDWWRHVNEVLEVSGITV